MPAAELDGLEILASAIAGRELRVDDAGPGALAWTDGSVVYVDAAGDRHRKRIEVCVQGALLAAGSLEPQLLDRLGRRREAARRYLAVEGRRALLSLREVLPPLMHPLLEHAGPVRTDTPAASVDVALGDMRVDDPPAVFGAIEVRRLLAAAKHDGQSAGESATHTPRVTQQRELVELPDDAVQEEGEGGLDVATSPVGGGGGVGKLLQKALQMVRQLRAGGPPGGDAPTHWSRSGPRAGARAMSSGAAAETVEDAFGAGQGFLYPEWNMHRNGYRADWCTVHEVDAPDRRHASVNWLAGHGLRRPLARLGMELDRFHRQYQGEDIDIDAAVEAQVQRLAGSAPDEAWYVESQRHRRDLSVLLLLDISGSVLQPGDGGVPVHEQQRETAAALATVLYEVGDRIALYAFNSRGRSQVHMVPVKRFDDVLDSGFTNRLHSLVPGAYSRLGAAIRHGSTVLQRQGGTSRQLLVLLSDGLAYDHGYEPAYGASDARQALREARRDGVGCLCLSIGAGTDTAVLRRVFGNAAFATVSSPHRLATIVGPLFRSALRSAEVQRRVA